MEKFFEKIKKIIFATLLCLLWGTSFPGHAASPETLSVEQEIEMVRAMNEATRQATVAAHIDTGVGSAEEFWPIYREYRGKANLINDELKKVILRYGEHYDTLSGEDAYSLASQTAALQINREKLKKDYMKQFSKTLTPRNAARVFQIENKLDALSQAVLASEIPLVNQGREP